MDVTRDGLVVVVEVVVTSRGSFRVAPTKVGVVVVVGGMSNVSSNGKEFGSQEDGEIGSVAEDDASSGVAVGEVVVLFFCFLREKMDALLVGTLATAAAVSTLAPRRTRRPGCRCWTMVVDNDINLVV